MVKINIKKLTILAVVFLMLGVIFMGIQTKTSYSAGALNESGQESSADEGVTESTNDVTETDLTNEKYRHLIGRTYYDEIQQATFMNFSASGFEVKFYGTKLTAYFIGSNLNSAVNRPYVTVMTDKDTDSDRGLVVAIRTEGETILAEGLIEGYHTVRVYKRSESTSSFLGVKYVKTDGRMVEVEDEEYAFNIEFFGDSITCGYGVDGKAFEEEFNTQDENALHTYAYYASKALNAKASFVSAGGFPLYKSLYSLDAPIDNIPDLIDKSFVSFALDINNPIYDVRANPKDIVVINLGTNDGSIADFIIGMLSDEEYTSENVENILNHINANLIAISSNKLQKFWNLPEAEREKKLTTIRAAKVYQDFINGFKNKYSTFINDLRNIYPNVKVVCASGMINFSFDLQKAIDDVVAEHSGYAYRLKHNSLSVGGVMPGKGHPNHAMHKFAGDELIKLIRENILSD